MIYNLKVDMKALQAVNQQVILAMSEWEREQKSVSAHSWLVFLCNRLDGPGCKEDDDQHKNDERPRGNVEVVGEDQSGNASQKAEKDGEQDHPGIVHREEVGSHLWYRDQRHQQYDPDQADAQYDGDGDEKHHHILDELYR